MNRVFGGEVKETMTNALAHLVEQTNLIVGYLVRFQEAFALGANPKLLKVQGSARNVQSSYYQTLSAQRSKVAENPALLCVSQKWPTVARHTRHFRKLATSENASSDTNSAKETK